ncbi:hypothetical protein C7I55_16645 [Sphingomonas deserti]|uniref:YCII-related domain-containing protein n=2 Tax=Allosphingosinicella deserti TaxID=2116704 RepID=A0A2P7QMC3_9SPHN|nr:hypothetical protein C7I55_16645 [Sphingomonas deserti]
MYVVLLEDDPAFADARARLMEEHLQFLERNGDTIRSAGPLRDEIADAGAGGLWIVDAPDRETVQALVEADPFWPTGLRKSVSILSWRQVFADGQRRI